MLGNGFFIFGKMRAVKRNCKVTPEMRELALEMYLSGVSINKIAVNFGLSYSSIQASLKRSGIVISAPAYSIKKLSSTDELKIAKYYQSGESMASIMEAFSIGHKMFRRIVKNHGIEIRKKVHLTDDERDVVADLLSKGVEIKEIAKKFGCDRNVVKLEMTKRGIDRVYLNRLRPEYFDIVCDEYLTRKITIEELCRKYNCDRRSICDLFSSRNISVELVYDRSKMKCVKYTMNEDYFSKIDTHEKAYIVGILFADGYITQNLQTIGLNLVRDDRYLLESIASEIEYTGPLYDTPPIIVAKTGNLSQPQTMLRIGCKKMLEPLGKIGIVPAKSLILKPPVGIPDDFMNSFILGYFDGDGCIHLQKRKKYVPQASISFAGTFEVLDFISNKIVAATGINKLPVRKHPNSNIFVVSWGGNNNAEKIFNYMYGGSSIFLKRKKEKFVECVGFITRRRNNK